jgi:festuclavine dehydrogenase
LERKIVHVKLTEAEYAKHLESTGMPPEDSKFFAAMETGIKNGVEEKMNNVVEETTGVAPERFYDFATAQKECWV